MGNTTIGEKKNAYLGEVYTPFFVKLDDDMYVFPGAIDKLYKSIIGTPDLACLTGLSLRDGVSQLYGGHSNFRVFGRYLMVDLIPLYKIISKAGVTYCDFTPEGHTIFRTSAVKKYPYDERYLLGYSHYDLNYTFKQVGYRSGVIPGALFDHRHGSSSQEYLHFHRNERLRRINISREIFRRKWGLEPLDAHTPSVTGRAIYCAMRLSQTIRNPGVKSNGGSPLQRLSNLTELNIRRKNSI